MLADVNRTRPWFAIAIVASACGVGGSSALDASGAGADGAEPDIDGSTEPTRLVAYVGGGADIGWYDVDTSTGALSAISSIPAFRTGASFLAVHGHHLYAVTSGDRVGAYSIDPETAGLTFINDVASGGSGPAHVSVDATGGFVLVANYGSGQVAVMPVQGDGGLAAATQMIAAGANAHQILTDPSNAYAVVPCLGDDKVAQYSFDAGSGALTANAVPELDTADGAGPRHIAFAPDGEHAYLINELDSTLSALAWDDATGRLTELQTVSSRANGATGPNTCAEVVVHPNGMFVYGSNRGDDDIAVFSIDASTGMMTLVDHESTQGMTPRNFAIDPTGRLLYAANQDSDTVVAFEIDPQTGRLAPTASPIAVPTPQFVGIVALPL
jgi:6-phosphogluconolactonase